MKLKLPYQVVARMVFEEAQKFLGTSEIRTRMQLIMVYEEFLAEEVTPHGKAIWLSAISSELSRLEKLEPDNPSDEVYKADILEAYSEPTLGREMKRKVDRLNELRVEARRMLQRLLARKGVK